MAKLVTAIFKTRSSSMLAVEDLMRHGIPQEDISVQMTDTNTGREFFTDLSSKAPEGGITGTIIGLIVGGVIGALLSRGYIPDGGIGMVNIGLLYGVLSGAAVGAIIGLIIGLLSGASVPEYESNFYALDARRGGGILVGVYVHERREGEIRHLLEAAGGTALRSKFVRTEPLRVHTVREYASVGGPEKPLPPPDEQ